MMSALSLKALWEFLRGPVGKWVLIAALVGVWTVGNRMDAARKARAECQTEQLEARLAAQEARAKEAERIAGEARKRAAETEQQIAAVERTRDELLDELADAGASCDLSDDIRERLRRIGADGSDD